jgi:hypothetical protein
VAAFGVASTTEAMHYLEFVRANIDDMAMLAKANVFVSHFPDGFMFAGTFRPDENTTRVLGRWPASYWDFARDLPLTDQQIVASFQGYLTFLASMAQQQRAILGTWSLDFQHQLIGAVEQLENGGPISTEPLWDKQDMRPKRQATEMALANRILERYLPAVDDLTFHDVLELRDRCASELKNFQISIQKLATGISLTQCPSATASEINDRISADVEPAIRDLEAKLSSARWNLIKSLPSKVGLTTAVTMAVTFFASGFPADIKTLLAVAAAGAATAASTAGDAVVDRKQLLREHQWSMVFRLTKLARRKMLDQQRRRDPL